MDVDLNEEFATALEAALTRARDRGLITGALTPGDLLRLPQALTIRERQAAADDQLMSEVMRGALAAVDGALSDLDTMRSREGDHLRGDLDQRRVLVADLVERIAVAADEGRQAMEQRLAERVQQLRTDLQADETAVAQEIVRTAARSDISEEVSRFRGHVAHWASLADGRGAVRPQARLPASGDEPRGEHDGLESRRPAGVGARHRGESRAREDARAGPER